MKVCERCGDAFGPHERIGLLNQGRLLHDWTLCRRCILTVCDLVDNFVKGR